MKLLKDMTDAEYGALRRAHDRGEEIEYWTRSGERWLSIAPVWASHTAYRVKPKTEVTEGTCWAFYKPAFGPKLVEYDVSDDCTEGQWAVTRVDGKLTEITWRVL